MRMSGESFRVVTPVRLSTSGSFGRARFTRFCKSTCARFRFIPCLNVTVSLYVPSLAHCDDMYNMFSTPLTICSMGAATVSATTWCWPRHTCN